MTEVVKQLAKIENYHALCHKQLDAFPMPNTEVLRQCVEIARSILFPGYFGNSSINARNIKYHIGMNIEHLKQLISEQIYAGLCFDCKQRHWVEQQNKASQLAVDFIAQLPEIRDFLITDVEAAFQSDPAAKSRDEIIFCYPAIRAIANYRIAHALLKLNVPIIPRIISEMAHSETGIDIHPGAEIGKYFTIDHGTGTVIGETTIIGDGVKLYQGVTLGAKSFPLDEAGNPIKGVLRHPIIEDGVTIYANSTILGRVTVGKDAIIGGNIWVDQDVPSGSKLVQKR